MLLKSRLGSGVTASGMIAGMHLGGARGVENLAKKGIDKKDGNGTAISSYVKRYSGYVIPWISESGDYSPVYTDSKVTTGKKTTNKKKITTVSKQDINYSDILPYIGYGLLAVVGIALIASIKS